MVFSLCVLGFIAHMSRQRTEASTHKKLAQLVNSTQVTNMLWFMEVFGTQVRVGPHWTPIGLQTEC